MVKNLVTAVIPTRNRPELVLRAVRSALAQSHEELEVVVVIDGPDAATREALGRVADGRLRVVALEESVGGSDARNKGVECGNGEWIAFLDDDDEWFPTKIEKQLELALRCGKAQPLVSCYFIGRMPSGDFVWPRRTPAEGEPLCEYLFARRSLVRGEAQLQTSLIFARRELLRAVPFKSGLRRHQDTDWYVRVAGVEGLSVEFVHEPLAVWYLEEKRPKITGKMDWRYSLEWLRSVRGLITRRAYAGFITSQLGAEASHQGDWKAFFPLLREAVFVGRVRAIDLVSYFSMWFVPVVWRKNFRLALRRVAPSRVEKLA
jgi:glycosyltransferase involved in cell wall biosynthesis